MRAAGVEPAARDPSSELHQIPHAVAAREEAASAIQWVPSRLSRKVGLREVCRGFPCRADGRRDWPSHVRHVSGGVVGSADGRRAY